MSKGKATSKILEGILPDFPYFLLKHYYFAETLFKDSKQKLSTILSRNQIILFDHVTYGPCPWTYSIIGYFLNVVDKSLSYTFSFVFIACIFSIILQSLLSFFLPSSSLFALPVLQRNQWIQLDRFLYSCLHTHTTWYAHTLIYRRMDPDYLKVWDESMHAIYAPMRVCAYVY